MGSENEYKRDKKKSVLERLANMFGPSPERDNVPAQDSDLGERPVGQDGKVLTADEYRKLLKKRAQEE